MHGASYSGQSSVLRSSGTCEAAARADSARRERVVRLGAGLLKETRAPSRLLAVADLGRYECERVQRPEEAAVRDVRPRDRAVTLPSVTPERVEAAMVAGTRERVRLDVVTGLDRRLRENAPDQARLGVLPCDIACVSTPVELGDGRVVGKERLGWLAQKLRHTRTLLIGRTRPGHGGWIDRK